MKSIKLFAVLFCAMSFMFISCSDTDDDQKSIASIAAENDNLSILVEALDAADLVSTLDGQGSFTVFAPTNDAFLAFLESNNFSSLEDVPTSILRNVLLNHVIGSKNISSNLVNGYVPTLASGPSSKNIDIYINIDNGVKLNGQSNVTSPDIEASNGVVHVVDQVIALPSVVTFATADPTFATLVSALTVETLGVDYVGLLSGEGPFTVFAPTNEAFNALIDELDGINALSDLDDATLNAVLQYHVINEDNILSSDLSDGMDVTTFGNNTFRISLADGAVITDSKGRETKIVVTDVQGVNGVVHVIERVLLP